MMKEETLIANDGFKLSAAFFSVENPKGIVQIVHGSLEHKERYYDFMNYLTTRGYCCAIIDLRGHGKSIDPHYPLGYMKSVSEIVDDLYVLTLSMKRRWPELPFFMFGHSLGSIFARDYLQTHDDELDGLVLSGTANPRFGAWLGPVIVSLLSPFVGGKYGHCKFFNKLAGLNKPYEEWLSYSQNNIEKHAKDKEMCPIFANGGFKVLFSADAQLTRYTKYLCFNPNLHILSVTGEDDPVTGGKHGLKKSVKALKKIGYRHIDLRVYEHMMHEVLNEDNHMIVYKDIAAFFDSISLGQIAMGTEKK